jgi:hypothetical protein
MPPPFRILRPTATPDGVLAAVIPLSAIHFTFPDMPQTNYYVVASLTVNAAGDWLLFDTNPYHSIRIPKESIHWQCGEWNCVLYLELGPLARATSLLQHNMNTRFLQHAFHHFETLHTIPLLHLDQIF